MLGSSKRTVFKPTAYGSSRRKRRIPRWFVLLLTGIALGAGGLLFLQQSYGPTRLTVEQSEQLHYDLNSANAEKQRLQTQLNQTSRELEDVSQNEDKLGKQTSDLQAMVTKLEKDIALFADAMPPDPRGTSPGIRAAEFTIKEGQLNHFVLLMQDKGKETEFSGTMELVAAGRYSNGRSGNVDLPGQTVSVGRYAYINGSAELPAGFTPRQVTIRIKPDGSNRVVATRTIYVTPSK
ncbi:MAG: hypothetical protein LKF64_12520 [Alcaligenes faecalis]|jgi:hypothetical protein|uniref:hypothetical protein n=1 Tax=Alcaligenes TaxID=507 RepID=UPI000F687D5D|nr:hypothetical protein [Alcaligenes aquatilis]MCH4225810.1 hypothetical protein [Alcaligenes faecalis]QXR36752.1 hypothetical protein EGK70_004255 [Alcaligenes aquatilis]